MKLAFLLSICFHAMCIIVLVVMPSRSRFLPQMAQVYEVELVSMPRIIEEPPPIEVPVTQERPVEPEPDPPVEPESETVETIAEESPPVEESPPPDSSMTASTEGATTQVKVAIEDFPYSYYLALLRYRIQENWRPPYQSQGDTDRMTAVVGFLIHRDGRVTDINLELSSRRFLFDQAAQRAIRAMGKLPPLPIDFSGEYLTVHIEFESIW